MLSKRCCDMNSVDLIRHTSRPRLGSEVTPVRTGTLDAFQPDCLDWSDGAPAMIGTLDALQPECPDWSDGVGACSRLGSSSRGSRIRSLLRCTAHIGAACSGAASPVSLRLNQSFEATCMHSLGHTSRISVGNCAPVEQYNCNPKGSWCRAGRL